MKYNPYKTIRKWIAEHKVLAAVILMIVGACVYYLYHSLNSGNSLPQYTLAPIRMGTISETVSGSGQVSSSNQTDILSQVSGTIRSIDVSVGQSVIKGNLIATIDSTSAAIDLESAKLSLQKLTAPPKNADLSNATNSLYKSYNDGFNAAANIYLDLPSIMSGMKDMLYGRTGYLSDQNITSLSPTARAYRDSAGKLYDKAVTQYQKSLTEFNSLSRSSATTSIESMMVNTFATIKLVSEAATEAQTAVTFISINQPEYSASSLATSKSDINTWTTAANSDLGSLLSAQNSIQTTKNSMTTLIDGSDPLDVRSAQLSLEQKQTAYDNYFIRAPYDGVIGRIPVSIFGQASASTIMATIVGKSKIATISLNEVDAAKVKTGQDVTITFDAIDKLEATGTVSQIDEVGTISSGVVSYGVKIAINSLDSRIKPGMSVNTSIITNLVPNVIVVPSSAIKKSGNTRYVLVFDGSIISMPAQNSPYSAQNQSVSSSLSSTTRRSFASGLSRATTLSTATLPKQVPVVLGASDDTNTEISSGLTQGQWVVTKTSSSNTSSSTAAPSILNSIGGSRGARPSGAGALGR